MDWRAVIEASGTIADLLGVAVILAGIAIAFVVFAREAVRRAVFPEAYRALRHSLGRAILVGLEILVAADIIRTVAIGPTLEDLAVLAGIVAIRTFLSFALEVELTGRWPWSGSQKDNGPARDGNRAGL